jgi:hypothetical protein
MKQHTPPAYSSIGLLITLTVITIIPPDSRASGPQDVGPSASVVAQNLFGPLSYSKHSSAEEFGRRGIKEVIRDKYRKRYEAWKNEFLSTESGRAQWEKYENVATLLLTITVSDDRPHDARTDRYEWTSSGSLNAATITLGCRLDEGYPSSESYPVIGSLSGVLKSASRRRILAASKFAHEFGHVNQAVANSQFQRQRQLIRTYNIIVSAKDHDRYDPRLTDLAQQLGATPYQIWTDWECLAETNALLYLQDKAAQKLIPPELLQTIFRNIKQSTNHCAYCFGAGLITQANDRF